MYHRLAQQLAAICIQFLKPSIFTQAAMGINQHDRLLVLHTFPGSVSGLQGPQHGIPYYNSLFVLIAVS